MRFIAGALAAALLCARALAQTPTEILAPFPSGWFENFESAPLGASSCISTSMGVMTYGHATSLCAPTSSLVVANSGNSAGCTIPIAPNSGAEMVEVPGGALRIVLDAPAAKFGGVFWAEPGWSNGTATFFDETGAQLGAPLALSGITDCSWNYVGWIAASGSPFQTIEIDTQIGFWFDDLQADYFDASVTTPLFYCTAKTSSHHCVPALSTNYAAGVSFPCFTAASSNHFVVTASNIEGLRNGVFFYGVLGQRAMPFACSGYLCLRPPLCRTFVQNSGGHLANCDGVLSIDFNAWMHTSIPPLKLGYPFAPGLDIFMQAWFRDPGICGDNGMTDAVAFTME